MTRCTLIVFLVAAYGHGIPASAACTPAAGQFAVFTEPGFAGSCAVLGVGDFRHERELGIANDAIASLRVGPGTLVLACRDDDWGQPCSRVTSDLAELTATAV